MIVTMKDTHTEDKRNPDRNGHKNKPPQQQLLCAYIAVLNELFDPARRITLDRECFVVCIGIPVIIATLD